MVHAYQSSVENDSKVDLAQHDSANRTATLVDGHLMDD